MDGPRVQLQDGPPLDCGGDSGPTTNLLAEKAKRYGMTIIGSIYEKAGERYYNSSPVIGPDGRIVGKYWKTHLFDAPNRSDIPSGIRESDRVSAG